MHSLFSDVVLLLNGKRVERGDALYPFRSYVTTTFRYLPEALKQQGFAFGYTKDDYTLMDDVTNRGFITRKEWTKAGATKLFMGKLDLDLFKQERLMIPGVDVTVRLEKAKHSFAILNYDKELKPKVVITEAKLSFKTVQVNASVFDLHMAGLQKEIPATYPINRIVLETMSAKEKDFYISKEFLFHGTVPKYLLVSMINSVSFYGDFSKNPYNFQNYKIKYLHLTKDGKSVSYEPFEPDFSNKNYLREYLSIFQSNGILGSNAQLPISFDEYQKGYTHFQFNLSNNCQGVNVQPEERANLKLSIKFGEPLPESIIVLLYAVFDSNIYIHGSGVIVTDYT